MAQKVACSAQTLRNWIAKTDPKAGTEDARSAWSHKYTVKSWKAERVIFIYRCLYPD